MFASRTEIVRSESCLRNSERSSILAVISLACNRVWQFLSLMVISLRMSRLNSPISSLPICTLLPILLLIMFVVVSVNARLVGPKLIMANNKRYAQIVVHTIKRNMLRNVFVAVGCKWFVNKEHCHPFS